MSLRARIAAVVGLAMALVLGAGAVALHQLVEERLVASAEREARDGLLAAGVRLATGATPLQLMSPQPGDPYIQVLADGERLALPVVGPPAPAPDSGADAAVGPSTTAAGSSGTGAADADVRPFPSPVLDDRPCDVMVVTRAEGGLEAVPAGSSGDADPSDPADTVQGSHTTQVIESGTDDVASGVSDVPFTAIAPPDMAITAQFVAVDDSDVVIRRADVCGTPMITASLVRSDAAGESTITLTAAASLAETERTLRTIRTSSWFAVPLVALALALMAWYLVGRALRPVERMRGEADRISHGTLHHRLSVPEGSVDEIGRLAGTMNAMLDRLEQSQQRQRQFVSDASHELRSPLATARALLEVDGSPDARAMVLAQVDRLSSLVDDLLALARLDEIGPMTAMSTEVDLDEVVLAEVAGHRDHDVEVDVREVGPARLVADPLSMRRLVGNLVDNACRHATRRVQVALRVEPGGGTGRGASAVLVVDDDGTGIPVEERTKVFERFARLDEGRARDAGGAGIGLALVRSVAVAHGGSVQIEDAPIGGARIVVTLPIVAVPDDGVPVDGRPDDARPDDAGPGHGSGFGGD